MDRQDVEDKMSRGNREELKKPGASLTPTEGKQHRHENETTKDKIIQPIKVGAATVVRAGDFIGRLGTLIVMIVTTINTATVCVTSFIDGIYWIGGVHAFLLVFIHIPVIAVMIWLMVKARVEAIYRKIRPIKVKELADSSQIVDCQTEEKTETMRQQAENLAKRGQQINKAFDGGMM
ncbi:uncharacterized protein LOC131927231 isoform X2 [Physella acuta]|nr:uncharacterized protein LOC131927231 isoform X2 [Physella acuta]XP_059138979.1 uncharacterized protein LOC131927231 isoform X2 [Physella acuta]